MSNSPQPLKFQLWSSKRDKRILSHLVDNQITILGGLPSTPWFSPGCLSHFGWPKRVNEDKLIPICQWEQEQNDEIILVRGSRGYYLMDEFGYWILNVTSAKDLLDLLTSQKLPNKNFVIPINELENVKNNFIENIQKCK